MMNKKHKYSLVLLFLFLHPFLTDSCLYSQNATFDSIKSLVFSAENDSLKYELAINTAYKLENENFDTALKYYNVALETAKKYSWNSRIAKAYVNIGFAYKYTLNSTKSIDYIKKGIVFYKADDNKKRLMESYYNLGIFYFSFDKYAFSIESFKQAIPYALQMQDDFRLAAIFNNLGLVYEYSGMYKESNIYCFKALKISEKIGDSTIGIKHVNIALNYYRQQKYSQSLFHYRQAIKEFKKANDKKNQAVVYNDIGDVYSSENILDSADYYYDMAFEIDVQQHNKEAIARHYFLDGGLYFRKNQKSKALHNYKKALELMPENGSNRLRFSVYSNIVELLITMFKENEKSNNLLEAHKYALKANEIANEMNSYKMISESAFNLYRIYKILDRKSDALKFVEIYITANDSLNSEIKQKTIHEIQTKYETEKKDLEIQLLNTQNDLIKVDLIKNENLRKKQFQIILIIISAIILLSILLLIIFRFYNLSKKSNKVLNEQNKIILAQKNEIELLLKEMNHRVKNNLQIIISLFQLTLEENPDEKTQEILSDAIYRVKTIGTLHELLYKTENFIDINFRIFANKLVNQVMNLGKNDNIKFAINIDSELTFDVKTSVSLGIIITELLSNSIKYACNNHELCTLKLSLSHKKPDYELIIKDSGPGLPMDFDLNNSESLGLKVVEILSSQLNGTPKYVSDNGLEFKLIFKPQ